MSSILTGYYFDILEALYVRSGIKLFKIDKRIHALLYRRVRYYRCLDPQKRNVFILRCKRFATQQTWIGREELVVTKDMMFLAAASYVMITFRLPFILLDNFDRIELYPGEYASSSGIQRYKGHTDPRSGTVSLSWPDLVEGYEDINDGLNLGLHEFAHTIMLDRQHEHNNEAFATDLDLFIQFYKNKFLLTEAKKSAFFRDYAFQNIYEFFSIAVETFFEVPNDFSNKMPELYLIMMKLFRTDVREVFKNEGRYGSVAKAD